MSPTLVTIRPPGLGLLPTSTLTFLALVTLSSDPSLSFIWGDVRDVPLSCDRGGRRNADPLRTAGSSATGLVSNDVTDVTEERRVEFEVSVRSRETNFCCASGEFEAHLTFTVTLDCCIAAKLAVLNCFSFSFSPRCVYSRRNALVARLPD